MEFGNFRFLATIQKFENSDKKLVLSGAVCHLEVSESRIPAWNSLGAVMEHHPIIYFSCILRKFNAVRWRSPSDAPEAAAGFATDPSYARVALRTQAPWGASESPGDYQQSKNDYNSNL